MVELLHELSQEVLCRGHCHRPIVGDQVGREVYVTFGRVHQRGVAEAQNPLQVLLSHGGADQPGRGANHGRRLSAEGVGPIRSARPIDSVL